MGYFDAVRVQIHTLLKIGIKSTYLGISQDTYGAATHVITRFIPRNK